MSVRGSRVLATVIGTSLLLFSGTLPPAARESDPQPPPRAQGAEQMLMAVYRPQFRTSQGKLSLGTAFLIRVASETVLVTAHHLFGAAGGLDREYGGDELPGLITEVEAKSLLSDDLSVSSKNVLPIADALGYTRERIDGDVSAFVLEGESPALPLALGAKSPPAGAEIYLLAQDLETGRGIHAAKVLATPEKGLVYVFAERLNLRGTSGAPIVDDNGFVVGIHLGGGEQQGQTVGIANPVELFRPHLTAALARYNVEGR